MLKAMIDKILSLAPVCQLEIDGRAYTDRGIVPVKLPVPVELTLHTLTGIKDYLNENPDGSDLDTVLVHVCGPTEVRVMSRLTGSFEQRLPYLNSVYDLPGFRYGQYMDIETFIIELQSKFVQDETTMKMLQLVGNLTDDLIRVYADDGVTQEVTAKTGIGKVQNCMVPNPVELRPYRTFIEIEQPSGRFVFRLKSGTGTSSGRPAVALFEADGGMWQQEANRRIQKWLRDCIPENVVVIA